MRVFVDTNVLFPFSIMDLVLALAEDEAIELIWTERLLLEWERVIVREKKRSASSAKAVTDAIRSFFREREIHEHDYAGLVESMPSKDPDDRYHIAAAVAGDATVIVTWNSTDFPRRDLAQLGIELCDPDTFLCNLLGEIPAEVLATVVRVAGGKRRPPITPQQVLDAVEKAGVSRFARRARGLLRSN